MAMAAATKVMPQITQSPPDKWANAAQDKPIINTTNQRLYLSGFN